MNTCLNCGTELQGPYCHQCKQKANIPRITVRHLIRSLFATITNVDSGFWFTVKQLFTRPTSVLKEYVSGKTVNYYHPIRYFLIWIGLVALINISSGIYDLQTTDFNQYVIAEHDTEAMARQKKIQDYTKKFVNFIPLFLIPFYGWISYLLFRKKQYNYAEHLTFVTYILGQNAIIGLPIIALYFFVPSLIPYAILIGNIVGAFYLAYVYSNLFEISKIKAFFYGLLINFLGLITMILGMLIIGILIAIPIVLIKVGFG